ncbi:hypothetical protein [Aquimarina spinulae]|uniref:hypothetical protein n=1 Tax=Aquimarina spinulae TaxID=1192023 RepID=UPI000D55265C|nr:hypothetical protein [Aquimarina spinulae]
MKNDYEIDLTQIDSVRENLNGFWIPKNEISVENILWLDFDKNKNSAFWETIPYTSEIKRTEILPMKSCLTFVGLIKLDGKIQLEFVSLGGSDTTKIELLTKTKFRIDGITYLKHKGYEFLNNRKTIKKPQNPIIKLTELKNGRWISKLDSLSGIEIKNGKWFFFYKGQEIYPNNIYDYKINREYFKELGTEHKPMEYLKLVNQSDTLDYLILEYNDQMLNLIDHQTGNTLNYKPEKI